MGSLCGEQIISGCMIDGVYHDCKKCPNLIEMGDGGVSYSASDTNEPSDTIGKLEDSLQDELDAYLANFPDLSEEESGRLRLVAEHFYLCGKNPNVNLDGDLEAAARNYTDSSEWAIGENLEHLDSAFKAGAEWMRGRMYKQAEKNLLEKNKGEWLLENLVAHDIGFHIGRELGERQAKEEFEKNLPLIQKSWYEEGKIAGKYEGLKDDEKYQQGLHDGKEQAMKTVVKKRVKSCPYYSPGWGCDISPMKTCSGCENDHLNQYE